jgi:hypothetical protein
MRKPLAETVRGGGETSEIAEIVNEVRLIGIAEFEGELGGVHVLVRVKALQQLMQAVTADDPLR